MARGEGRPHASGDARLCWNVPAGSTVWPSSGHRLRPPPLARGGPLGLFDQARSAQAGQGRARRSPDQRRRLATNEGLLRVGRQTIAARSGVGVGGARPGRSSIPMRRVGRRSSAPQCLRQRMRARNPRGVRGSTDRRCARGATVGRPPLRWAPVPTASAPPVLDRPGGPGVAVDCEPSLRVGGGASECEPDTARPPQRGSPRHREAAGAMSFNGSARPGGVGDHRCS